MLRAYKTSTVGGKQPPQLYVTVNGVSGTSTALPLTTINSCSISSPCTIALDITGTRQWSWVDFDGELDLTIDQTLTNGTIYYDAIGLKVTSDPSVVALLNTQKSMLLDDLSLQDAKIMLVDDSIPTFEARLVDANPVALPTLPAEYISVSGLKQVFNKVIRATDIWNETPAYVQGQGVSVAVVDSGIFNHPEIRGRLLRSVNFNQAYHNAADRYGHGTLVSSVIAADGSTTKKGYMGIAPKTNLLNVRVSDDQGFATEADVVAGLQWILQNKDTYAIRVVNLSLNTTSADSYLLSPLDAACEILWFNGIVVVVSAGNNGAGVVYPPANDPFVITVGAADDRGTVSLADDLMATFSASGVTPDGIHKPDLVAPGRNIIAYLPDNALLGMGISHPKNRVDKNLFRMSGTSLSAPMVAGAVALLLQDEPNLTPDQVKYRLMATAAQTALWPGYDPERAGAGYLDVYGAVKGTSSESANQDLTASQLLWSGSDPVTWSSVSWNSVSWNSVAWNSVAWNSVAWNSVSWNSDYWEP
ncbi:MAG: S8 family peptidase [Anaerolineaceae bacterium]|nr:S8 family peptidase [Anaerolineaceae bacterium]